MKALWHWLALVALLTCLAGCGATKMGENAEPTTHDNQNLPAGDIGRGAALTAKYSCAECHTASYGGADFYPNITPDPQAGIGSWTTAQIAAAIRDGTYIDGTPLCGLMEQFPFSDQDVADVIAYLRSLPPLNTPTNGVCPGHGAAR